MMFEVQHFTPGRWTIRKDKGPGPWVTMALIFLIFSICMYLPSFFIKHVLYDSICLAIIIILICANVVGSSYSLLNVIVYYQRVVYVTREGEQIDKELLITLIKSFFRENQKEFWRYNDRKMLRMIYFFDGLNAAVFFFPCRSEKIERIALVDRDGEHGEYIERFM